MIDTDVSRILMRFDHDRNEARDRYRETFGIAVDDPALDDELERLLRDQRSDDKVELPPRLVLALVLRPRSKGQGRPPRPKWARRQAAILVRKASRRWDELVEAGGHIHDPKGQAAEEVHAEAMASGEFEYAGLSVETLLRKMRRNMPR